MMREHEFQLGLYREAKVNKSISRARLVRAVLAGALLVPLLLWVSGCWLFNVPPIAAFTINSQTGQVPFAVNFSAVLSDDEDGIIIQWEWDFGDGTSGSGENVTHTYTEAGTFTVVLRVTDDDGESGTTNKKIYVNPAEPEGPIASFTVSPTSGTSPLRVYVDASASSYDAGVISQYEWNWGDGSVGYASTASHTYFSSGAQTFTLTLTVHATDGKTGTATSTVTVTVPGGTTPAADAPSARFIVVDDAAIAGGPAGSTCVAPFNALFDPEDTKAADGKTLLQLIWSFGDGSSASTANVVTQWHMYVTNDPSEVFSVTLVAMDNDAVTDSITKTVKAYNHQPVAGFEIINPDGGHTIADDDEEYANVAAARAVVGRWDDDEDDDGVTMGDLQNLAGATVNVFIRSRLTTDAADWYGLVDTGAQDTLEMAEGVLAAPGTTKPVPDDFAATNNAFSYDPEGQYWPLGEPVWFPNQAWGIQWIYVDWDDGPEEQFDYVAECNNVGPYDQDAIMGHTYAYPGGAMTKTITIRVVDFLGGQSTLSRTVHFMWGTEGSDDL